MRGQGAVQFRHHSASLCYIVVLVLVVLFSFHVVSINQRFDAFLEVGRLQRGWKLVNGNWGEFFIRLTFTGKVSCLYNSLINRL